LKQENKMEGEKRGASHDSDPNAKRQKLSPNQRPTTSGDADPMGGDDLVALLEDYPAASSPEADEAVKEKQARREAYKKKCEKVQDPVGVRDLLQSVQDGTLELDGSTTSNSSGSKGHDGHVDAISLSNDEAEKDVLLSIMFLCAMQWSKPLKIFMSKNLPVICDVFKRSVEKYKVTYLQNYHSITDHRGEYVVQSVIRVLKRIPIDKSTLAMNKEHLLNPIKSLNSFMHGKIRAGMANEKMREVEQSMNELLKRWADNHKAQAAMVVSRGNGNGSAPPTPASRASTPMMASGQTLESERAMFREIFMYALLGQHVTGLRASRSAHMGANGTGSPKDGPSTPNALSRSNSHYAPDVNQNAGLIKGGQAQAGGLLAMPPMQLNGAGSSAGNGHGAAGNGNGQNVNGGSPRHTLKLDKVVPIAEVPKGAESNPEKYKAELVAGDMEKALYARYVGDPSAAELAPLSKEYRVHGKMLASNIRDTRNHLMRHELLNTDVNLDEFVTYDSDKLAPPELKEERAKAEEKMINQPIVRNIELPDLNNMADLNVNAAAPQQSFDEAALIRQQNSLDSDKKRGQGNENNANAQGQGSGEMKVERSGSSVSSGSGGESGRKKSGGDLTVDNFGDGTFAMTPYFHHSVATPAMVFEDEHDGDALMRNLLDL
jgi:hypothetical protein